MNDFPISGAECWTMGGDLSFGSSGNAVVYFFASWAASVLETALLTSAESSLGESVIWLEPEGEGSPDILFGEGVKELVEEVGKGGGEFIGVIKFDTMGMMFKH